jgi:hypothetical protein
MTGIHRVDRVPGFLAIYSRPNWLPPSPRLTLRRVLLPPGSGGGGETHSLAGEGAGGGSRFGRRDKYSAWFSLGLI